MPVIDLREIPVAVINLPFQERRRNRVVATLENAGIGFTLVPGVRDKPRHRGCSQGHLAAIEGCAGRAPFLVLEDDIALTEWFQPTIEVPDDCDLFYLGHSPFGYSPSLPRGDFGTEIVERVSDDRIKVHSMLAAHAILYMTDSAAAAVSASIRASIEMAPPGAMTSDFVNCSKDCAYMRRSIPSSTKARRCRERTSVPCAQTARSMSRALG